MQQEKNASTTTPFFDLLAEADEIQVREIPRDGPPVGFQPGKRYPLNIEELNDKAKRAFVVVVKSALGNKDEVSKDANTTLPRQYLLESADLLVKSLDFLLARNVYSFLLKQNIRDNDALKGLGICFFRLGDAVSSRKCFRAFYEISNEEEGLFWLGLSESAQENDSKAAEYFGLLTRPELLKKEMQFDFFKEAGNVYTRLNRIEDAESCYRSAMSLNPASDTIFANLGTLSLHRKRYEAAHTHFVKAISLNPLNARGYCGLGLAALELGQTVFAERQFKRAVELDSQNLGALTQLVKLAEDDNKISFLKIAIGRFLEKDRKNSDAKYLHAVCEYKVGRYSACQKEIEGLLKDDPKHEQGTRLRESLVKHLQSLGGNA